jgi:hypothetical protein
VAILNSEIREIPFNLAEQLMEVVGLRFGLWKG